MKKKIAVLSGDGIGPEVIEQALKVLDAVADRFGHQFLYTHSSVGAKAIDETGTPLPDETLDNCLQSDAILFGAIGDPKYDNDPNAKVRPEQGLLKLRKSLGLFCNIRPVAAYDGMLHLSPLREERVKGVNIVIYRELTSGIYFGDKGRNEAGDEAFDICRYHKSEILRIAHLAFKAAQQRRKKVTLIDKANVLETSRLWRETFQEIAGEYPDVTTDCMFVDNAAMQMIVAPTQFDVILTSNMFGDIISDEASVIPGSLGLLPSASVGSKNALFEPIHGSYPQAAGEDIANPMATILSAAMMLDHLEMQNEAIVIRQAVRMCLEERIGTPDLSPTYTYSCSQIGDLISSIVLEDKMNLKKDKISEGVSTII